MEKRILGIILSVLGIGGLIYAGVIFMNGGTNALKTIIFTGVLGAIFFVRYKLSQKYNRQAHLTRIRIGCGHTLTPFGFYSF